MNREYGANPPRPTVRNEGARLHVTRDRGEVHPLLSDIIGVELAWADDRALCASVDPEAWWPEQGNDSAASRAICHGCPLLEPCLRYALEHPDFGGIWGGTSSKDRKELRRKRRAA